MLFGLSLSRLIRRMLIDCVGEVGEVIKCDDDIKNMVCLYGTMQTFELNLHVAVDMFTRITHNHLSTSVSLHLPQICFRVRNSRLLFLLFSALFFGQSMIFMWIYWRVSDMPMMIWWVFDVTYTSLNVYRSKIAAIRNKTMGNTS